MYKYTQVTRVRQDIPHHMSGTFNKHSSLAIFDEHLVRQTNQGYIYFKNISIWQNLFTL